MAGPSQRMTLKDHLLMRYRLWQAERELRREMRKSELPAFYRRAEQTDVDGIVINGGSWTVGDFLPVGFEAYVRLPNPFWKIVAEGTEGAVRQRSDPGDDDPDVWAKPVRNSEIAEANGLRMTHDTGSGEICGPSDGYRAASADQAWSWGPSECNIEPFVADRLFRILSSETDPKDRCLSGQWEGGSSGWDSDVRLATRGWSYFVWRARFCDIAEWLRQPCTFERDMHVPQIVWPVARQWFLATLYSGHSNYLAGSRTLIDTVLTSGLEAYEVGLTDKAF
ncbi:MAG: hypothetical protein OXH68_16595 [Gammaproteobacteria bacterium]|nr:hypothetical protein [Gammaproteobacteria bacterium]